MRYVTTGNSKMAEAADSFIEASDAAYWRAQYEQAARERDEARQQVREMAIQVLAWARSESGASDVLVAAYRRAGELGETIAPSGKRVEGCVYYIRRPGNRVKIGWSSAFRARMQALHVPAEDVLAVESGGMELEVARHRQFEASNLHGSEVFEMTDTLASHIAECRASSKIHPYTLGCRLAPGRSARVPA